MSLTDSLIPLLSLIALEVILGVDNIIFISILSDKLPEHQRNKLRYWGIGLAMVMRLALLAFISWILKLDKTVCAPGHRVFRQRVDPDRGWVVFDL